MYLNFTQLLSFTVQSLQCGTLGSEGLACAGSFQGFKGRSNKIVKEIQRGLRHNQFAAVLEFRILGRKFGKTSLK